MGLACVSMSCPDNRCLRQLIASGQQGHTSFVNSACFSPDSTMIVTGGGDNTTRSDPFRSGGDNTAIVWLAASGEMFKKFEGHTGCVNFACFSPDSTMIVTASTDNTAIVWLAASGEMLKKFEGHTDWVISASFSPDSTMIVTASRDNTAIVWLAASGEMLKKFEGHTDCVHSTCFSPDSTMIVTGSGDGTLIVWLAASGEMLKKFEGHGGWVNSACFSPDSTMIVTGGWDTTAIVWLAASGEMLKKFEGHTDCVHSACFSPDSTMIVTASRDNTAIVWLAASGEMLKKFEGHTDWVNSACFSPDSTMIVTASTDLSVRVHDTGKFAVKLIIDKLSLINRITPWASNLLLLWQMLGFATSRSYPWNVVALEPVQWVRYLAMVDLDRLDFPGSHKIFSCIKVVLAYGAAIDLVYLAFAGKLFLSSRLLSEKKEKRIREVIAFAMVNVLFVPTLTTMVTASCQKWSSGSSTFPSISSDSSWQATSYWILFLFTMALVPFFLWSMVPFIFSGGDVSLISPEDIWQPTRWVQALNQKQRRQHMGLFDLQTGHAPWAGAVSDMILKVAVPMAAALDFGMPSAIVSLIAVFQRWATQVALPLYKQKTANIFLLGCKTLMLGVQLAGVLMLAFFGHDAKQHPLWPELLFYLGALGGTLATYICMVRQAEHDIRATLPAARQPLLDA